MNLLSFYVSEKQHHAGMPLYEWLLERARFEGCLLYTSPSPRD